MKLKREITNGVLIFLGIGVFFLLMELLGLADVHYLRVFNVLIVFFFVNKTLKANIHEGKNDYLQNVISAGLTSLIGVFLSIAALRIYIVMRGGDEYLKNLSEVFIFGSQASVNEYCIGLLFEGVASSMIATFVLMQYWKRYTAID